MRPFGQIVLSDGGEYLDGDRIFEYFGSMDSILRNAPGISRNGIVLGFADLEKDVAFDQVSCLLIRVGVMGKKVVLT
jgi:hypothetical protein